MSPDLPLSEDDWQQTPATVQALVVALWEQVRLLQAEVAALRERLGQTSHNSSRPPSTDPPGQPKRERKPTGRKPGGQLGHPGVGRSLRPVEEVEKVVVVKPSTCGHCGHPLGGEDPAPRRHQVTEIPPVVATTTEYQLHTLWCPGCGQWTSPPLPVGVPLGSFGPRLQAMVAVLSGAYRMTKRNIERLMADFFGVEVGLGSVSNLEQATSEALQDGVEEARAYVKEQRVVNLDETGWREGTDPAWLWVAVTGGVTVFLVRLSRGAKVVKELLGEGFGGVVGSDRWSGYNGLEVTRRQLCWAHLIRDFQALVDRGGESARVGEALLSQAKVMFGWWQRVRDGTLKRSSFRVYMGGVRTRVGELLREGEKCAHAKTARTCRNLLKGEAALWTFVRVEGVEPTNNAAERAVRPGVLWRKGSWGTQSEAGSRFAERMLTVVATLRQQKRNVLAYVTAACQAAIRGEVSPSLLPREALGELSQVA